MTVRAKMRCTSKTVDTGGSTLVVLHAVYSAEPDSENKAFTDATPSAYLALSIAKDKPAADLFEANSEYYLDISKAGSTA